MLPQRALARGCCLSAASEFGCAQERTPSCSGALALARTLWTPRSSGSATGRPAPPQGRPAAWRSNGVPTRRGRALQGSHGRTGRHTRRSQRGCSRSTTAEPARRSLRALHVEGAGRPGHSNVCARAVRDPGSLALVPSAVRCQHDVVGAGAARSQFRPNRAARSWVDARLERRLVASGALGAGREVLPLAWLSNPSRCGVLSGVKQRVAHGLTHSRWASLVASLCVSFPYRTNT